MVFKENSIVVRNPRITVIAAILFLASFLPLVALNLEFTGDPAGLVKQFFSAQVKVDPAYYALPDRIPSNFLAIIFLLGAASPFLWLGLAHARNKLGTKGVYEPLLFALGFAAVLEVYALLNFALLRYIAVVVPFLAVAAGAWLTLHENERVLGVSARNWLLCACVINLIIGAGVLGYFNLAYAKHVDYREAGLYLAANCHDVFSNIWTVTKHYANGTTSYLPSAFTTPPDCIADSKYDVWNYRGAFGYYSVAYTHGGVTVYQR